MKRVVLIVMVLVPLLGDREQAKGDIITTTGEVHVITPPPSVKLGALESDTQIQTFAEKVRFSLPTSVAVDITTAGTYATIASLTPGTIASGTLVDSYYMYTDPIDSHLITYDGSVTFNTNILGVIVLDHELDLSDSVLGALGTLYPTGLTFRGLELTGSEDSVMVSADLRTLTFHAVTDTPQDDIRIITAASPLSAAPEPSSLALLGIGTVCSLGYGWRRRRQSA